MNAALVIARQEFANGLRNRWVAGAIGLMALFALSLALLGSAPAGTVGAPAVVVLVVSLASLSIFLIPLIALLLAHDAIAGEAERGTLLLLLAYPIERSQLLAGKFLGHLSILLVAVVLGFGSALAAVAASQGLGGGLGAFAVLMASALMLGAVFLAFGYLASALVRERATAVGIAIGVWLIFVIVYDLLLLGVLVLLEGGLPQGVLTALLMLNPADVFRLLNLAGTEASQAVSGIAAVGGKWNPGAAVLWSVLAAWVAIAMTASWAVLRRRDF